MGLAHDFVSWLVLRFIAGVASAWALVYVSSWCLERLALLRRPTLNSVVFTGVGTGVLIAGVICLALMSAHPSSSGARIGPGARSLLLPPRSPRSPPGRWRPPTATGASGARARSRWRSAS